MGVGGPRSGWAVAACGTLWRPGGGAGRPEVGATCGALWRPNVALLRRKHAAWVLAEMLVESWDLRIMGATRL